MAVTHLGPFLVEVFPDMILAFLGEDSSHVVFGELVPIRRCALAQTVSVVLATSSPHVAGSAQIVAASFALIAACHGRQRYANEDGKTLCTHSRTCRPPAVSCRIGSSPSR